ncbi:MAG: 1,4-alpha-glucan branching protein GlgB [Gammaproteobacteria bacterium]|nr:MAG: 1,4-alpha-glucan branching protein GlgB [Gammaproteobacteria bacterium]
MTTSDYSLPPEAIAIQNGCCHDPFSWLGRHQTEQDEVIVRTFQPRMENIWLVPEGQEERPMQRIEGTDFFVCVWPEGTMDIPYHFRVQDKAGDTYILQDPYRFGPVLGDLDLHLIGEGNHYEKYRILGAHPRIHQGVSGVSFAVWAPSARAVAVSGNFNHWDERAHYMRCRGSSGVWELFIPGLTAGEVYKYRIRTQDGTLLEKTDPYAQQMELRPATASVVHDCRNYCWQDEKWIRQRPERQALDRPLSIYEVNLGSWKKQDGQFLNYRELAHQLVEYCQWMGYTHIELMPVTEYPFDGSWGYQVVGYFAPTSRFGNPDDFRYFVDFCHQHDIGVFLDWVPAHFPKDEHGLARFDGTALYEHEDPRLGEHKDWGTYIFNYGRNEVRNFLIASALYWLDQFHIDGLRVDAVASMLYLDYSREPGEWLPNVHGGRENLEAVEFLKQFNCLVHQRFPGVVTMAEESTSWPMVSRPTDMGGLGFTMKWNMGWMNDTLSYMSRDPIHRQHHHHELTFSMVYAFTENFILPFSHDEVVHGKGSMPDKMPGDDWQKFANLRLLYTYMFTHPGKKLQFMGIEFGQWQEWNYQESIAWDQSNYMPHRGLQHLVRDLNNLYRHYPELHELDFDGSGFEWIDCDDASRSLLSFIRKDRQGHFLMIVVNMTPVPHHHYRTGVPIAGTYREIFNSDAEIYGGSNLGNGGVVESIPESWSRFDHTIEMVLPPLACVILQPRYD